jgi:flavodoxin
MGSPVLEKNGFIIKCYECDSESVDFTYNDGAVLFVCSNCGHQEDEDEIDDEIEIGEELLIIGELDGDLIAEAVVWEGSKSLGGFEITEEDFKLHVENGMISRAVLSILLEQNKKANLYVFRQIEKPQINIVYDKSLEKFLSIEEIYFSKSNVVKLKGKVNIKQKGLTIKEAIEWLKNN